MRARRNEALDWLGASCGRLSTQVHFILELPSDEREIFTGLKRRLDGSHVKRIWQPHSQHSYPISYVESLSSHFVNPQASWLSSILWLAINVLLLKPPFD